MVFSRKKERSDDAYLRKGWGQREIIGTLITEQATLEKKGESMRTIYRAACGAWGIFSVNHQRVQKKEND